MSALKIKENREAISFIIKSVITVIGALFALLFGTAHLAKLDQEQLLKAKLIASTDINGLKYGTYTTASNVNHFCYVSGSYQVTNKGQYPFIVDSVTIELWKLPYIEDINLEQGEAISYSLSDRMQSNSDHPAIRIGDPVVIPVGEQFGVGNLLQRSFGFIVPIIPTEKVAMAEGTGDRYVVIANASARLDDRQPWYGQITKFIAGDPGISFLQNDLRHLTGTFNICQKELKSEHI